MTDTEEIRAVIDGIDNAVDAKDWGRARSFFTDEIDVDFTSLAGGEPATIPSDALIDSWRSNLTETKKSFHLRGNHEFTIDGDTARVFSKGYAYNRIDDRMWEIWGGYTHDLVRTAAGWRCSGMALHKEHARGDDGVRTA